MIAEVSELFHSRTGHTIQINNMNIEAGGFLKVELFNDDANLFLNALTKITNEGGKMGFKTYGLTEDEIKLLNAILDTLG